MNLYGFAGGDPVNFSDPFGLCWWDGCIAEGAAVPYLAGAIAATTATYLATHPEAAAALAQSLSDGAALASDGWDGLKKKVWRGAKGIALIGGMLAGGETANSLKRWSTFKRLVLRQKQNGRRTRSRASRRKSAPTLAVQATLRQVTPETPRHLIRFWKQSRHSSKTHLTQVDENPVTVDRRRNHLALSKGQS